jgi:hypothetical protein
MRDGRLTQTCRALRQTVIKFDNAHDVVFVTKDLSDASHGGLVLQNVDVDLLIQEMVAHIERGRCTFVKYACMIYTRLNVMCGRSNSRYIYKDRERER